MALRRAHVLAGTACVAWSTLMVGGLGISLDEDFTPGDRTRPPPRWPQHTSLKRAPGRAALVMFVHPRCPCARASIEELARIVARAPDPQTMQVVFIRPCQFDDGWERTALWASAAAIPGVSVVSDIGCKEAVRFNARTSGQVFLFDARGALMFAGGITSGRGHIGDNAGAEAVIAALRGDPIHPLETFVFGCPLFDSAVDASGGRKPCRN